MLVDAHDKQAGNDALKMSQGYLQGDSTADSSWTSKCVWADSISSDAPSDSDSDNSVVNVRKTKLDEEVRAFVRAHRGLDENEAHGKSQRRRKTRAEPSGQAKLRLTQASDAFIAEEYEEALRLTMDALRLNGEVPRAWSLLSSVWEELGEHQNAVMAKLFSVQLTPRDAGAWIACAECALRWLGRRGNKALEIASYCYSAALRARPHDVRARLGKASVEIDLGRLPRAIAQYSAILEQDPVNLEAIRGFAECSLDGRGSARMIERSRAAYRRCLTTLLANGVGGQELVSWSDVMVYAELSSCLGFHVQAISDLKSLGRWLLGRGRDPSWGAYHLDDREWDEGYERRSSFLGYDPSLYPDHAYHMPLDVRLRLAVYRLRRGDVDEARYQLSGIKKLVDFNQAHATNSMLEIAELLFQRGAYADACEYYEALRVSSAGLDSTALVHLGICYSLLGADSQAEDCYITAINEDPTSISARIELATLYERSHEKEEAYLLVAEAIKLRKESGIQPNSNSSRGACKPHAGDVKSQPRRRRPRRGRDYGRTLVTRYHPRKLVSAEQKRRQEQERTQKLKSRYELVQSLRAEAHCGSGPSFSAWMAAAGDLVDDFRSFKEFYHWEKYLGFLRRNAGEACRHEVAQSDPQLADMEKRLTKSKNCPPELPRRDQIHWLILTEIVHSRPDFKRSEDRTLRFVCRKASAGSLSRHTVWGVAKLISRIRIEPCAIWPRSRGLPCLRVGTRLYCLSSVPRGPFPHSYCLGRYVQG